jgi:3-hydroxyisobutyrate dehydrogenase-like beta-hydroxyacid dehydrogenase
VSAGERIGLIGAGLLGSALAERLLAAGFRLVAFDIDPECLARIRAMGGELASSAGSVAARSMRIVVCLPNSDVTGTVLEEVLPAWRKGALLIDTTTGEPAEMERHGGRAGEAGVAYLEATVAGSSRQARAGEAIVMAGGERAAFEACRDLFGAFAARSFHVGPWGAGARMKLVVNLVLGLNRAVLAEGLAFAETCGVDPVLALEVLKAGPAYSRAMDVKGAKMLARDWTPEARLKQHHKDVRLILAEAAMHGARVPFSELHERLLAEAEEAGFGNADNAAVLELFKR